ATTAARDITRSGKARQDISLSSQTLEDLQSQLADLESQFEAEAALMKAKTDALAEAFEEVQIKPKKSAIEVQLMALAWVPYWHNAQGGLSAA
ncbi:MAG: hypothetical protein U1B80_08710, partial [Anaerolineaceae bacterium]|nr:hypothetical protein [Anaerolineaceae bacterium]